jgi:hypothetical protein
MPTDPTPTPPPGAGARVVVKVGGYVYHREGARWLGSVFPSGEQWPAIEIDTQFGAVLDHLAAAEARAAQAAKALRQLAAEVAVHADAVDHTTGDTLRQIAEEADHAARAAAPERAG